MIKKMQTNKKETHTSKRQFLLHDLKINRNLYIMMIPVLVYFLLFKYLPMYGALMAFQDYSPKLGVWGSKWVGLKHFINFVTARSFWGLLGNTFRISFSSLIFGFPAPILLALLMNELQSMKFKKVVQNITYLPHFISLVVVCGLVKDFTMNDGVIGNLVEIFGGEPKTLLNYPEFFVPVYIISDIWQGVGWGTIIYLSALSAVDSTLYEAATIDGAGRFKQVLHITLPGIAPTIVIMLILRLGSILNVGFEKIILLYNDSTMSVADVISSYVYRRGLINLDWSFSSAVGLFNSVINLIFLIGSNYINKRVNESSLW
ncbi:MAG: sugar ABC transporter permease [Clostridia bacterium]|nr:sugar ABC transporter permease [Clostridia bacterium]